jgi:hypothetical protein
LNLANLKSKYKFTVFGLNFESDINCPDLSVSENSADVIIRFGNVPETLGDKSFKGVCFEAIPGALIITAKNIARYFITEGKEIVVMPEPEAKEQSIRLFLLGSAMGALLHQRGILPLHGNGVCFNKNGILFTGTSGVGKSTLAAMMALKGFKPITDDIAAIGYMNEIPVMLPGLPHLKLWQDSILKMNLKTKGLKKVRDELEKYYYPVKNRTFDDFIPLKKIYIMNINNQEGIAIKPLTGIEKFTVLKNHTYRYTYVKSMNLEKNHFDLTTRLASKIEISRLYRGKKGFDAGELADAVIHDIKNM